MQPLVKDKDGVIRFKANQIVRYLLDNGGTNLNQLRTMEFSHADWIQFMQLIGYSVSGYGDLDYIPRAVVREADRRAAIKYGTGVADKDKQT